MKVVLNGSLTNLLRTLVGTDIRYSLYNTMTNTFIFTNLELFIKIMLLKEKKYHSIYKNRI